MSQTPIEPATKKEGIPEGLWMRCPDCGDMLFRKVVEENLSVCPSCDCHMRLSARQRITQLVDQNAFEEMFEDLEPVDPLNFVDKKAYSDRLVAEQMKTGNKDAVVCGKGFIKGRPIMMAVMDPTFMMGSMGSVVGEKITRTIEIAAEKGFPLLIVSCSGGGACRRARSASCRWPRPARRCAARRCGRTVYLPARRPNHRRRHSELRDAWRFHHRRAQGAHRFRRATHDLEYHQGRITRRISTRRIS